MGAIERYHGEVSMLLDRVVGEEAEHIRTAAGVLADVLSRDRLIFVFGTGGHSVMGAEEMARRAGGLVPVYPILDPGLSILFGPARAGAATRPTGNIWCDIPPAFAGL